MLKLIYSVQKNITRWDRHTYGRYGIAFEAQSDISCENLISVMPMALL
jgi:hypothetical protein